MNKCLIINNTSEFNIKASKYIFGIKNYNFFPCLELDIDEASKFFNENIIISLNKLYQTDELENLLIVLKKLENKVYGVIFDDPAVYNIVKNNKLNIKLIWGNIHGVCSYNSINSWYKLGVEECIISPDITINDILEIRKNTKSILYVNIFGRVNISSSKRLFLTNYFSYINTLKKNNKYFIENKNNKYPIYETENNSFILSEIINGLDSYKLLQENNIDNVIFNSYDASNIEYIMSNLSDENNKYTGFLYKDSIYKVGDIND